MDYEIQNFFDWLIPAVKDFFTNSPFILVVKILVGIYLFILIVDIVLLLIARDVPSSVRTGLRGTDIPTTPTIKMKKRWQGITARLKTGNVSQYKVAIIEADALADELLGKIGFVGKTMAEKFEQVGANHLDGHLEELQRVHEIRNRIVHETDFEVDESTAKAVLGVYENFLKYLEYLD